MAPRFELTELMPRHAAAIRERVPVAEAATFLSLALPELWHEVKQQRRRALSPPYVRYHGVDDQGFDLEAGLIIGAPPARSGRVRRSGLPGGAAATAWHEGAYERLGDTRQQLTEWIAESGLEPVEPHWEVYWTNAGSTDKVERWRTQLVWPVTRTEEGVAEDDTKAAPDD